MLEHFALQRRERHDERFALRAAVIDDTTLSCLQQDRFDDVPPRTSTSAGCSIEQPIERRSGRRHRRVVEFEAIGDLGELFRVLSTRIGKPVPPGRVNAFDPVFGASRNIRTEAVQLKRRDLQARAGDAATEAASSSAPGPRRPLRESDTECSRTA